MEVLRGNVREYCREGKRAGKRRRKRKALGRCQVRRKIMTEGTFTLRYIVKSKLELKATCT